MNLITHTFSKNAKKSMVILLLSAIVISLFPHTSGYAASIRLNKKTASVPVGKSIRLSVSGTKKSVKWSSSDYSVAKVSNGKVTGKKPGKAIITAKVAGKTLKCTIKVKYNADVAEKKIQMKKQELNEGLLLCYTNRNAYPVSIVTNVQYRDSKKTVLSETEEHNFCLEPGRKTWMYFPKPVDDSYNYMKYQDYKINMVSGASKYKGYTKDITQWCQPDKITMDMTAYNYSGKTLTAAKISCLLYNNKNQIIGYVSYYPSCLKKGSHCEEMVNYPAHCQSPAKVESYVDYAY